MPAAAQPIASACDARRRAAIRAMLRTSAPPLRTPACGGAPPRPLRAGRTAPDRQWVRTKAPEPQAVSAAPSRVSHAKPAPVHAYSTIPADRGEWRRWSARARALAETARRRRGEVRRYPKELRLLVS